MSKNKNLKEVALLFLKLGFFAFGGPAAHVAMMEDEVVKKRKWFSGEHFLDLLGATNLIPGPNSTEMTMHCGHERAGIVGLFVAGACFIFPAALITLTFAWFYTEYGSLPAVEPFLYGIKPAIIAIIIKAIYNLGKSAWKNWQVGLIGALALASSFLGLNEIAALLGAGILSILWFSSKDVLKNDKAALFNPFVFLSLPSLAGFSSGKLFFIFLKVGATLFGSGYVLVAYLQAELVEKTGWITQQQLLDAIAIGQFTPGPLFTTATFIGYQIHGISGAVLATIGIFLPAFILVLIINPFVPKLRKSKVMGYFMDGVNMGAVAVMAAVTFQLGADVLVDWQSWIIAVAGLIVVLGFKKVNATWVIIGGALLGYLFSII